MNIRPIILTCALCLLAGCTSHKPRTAKVIPTVLTNYVDTFATYSTNRLYYLDSPSTYQRQDYQWYLRNTGQNSVLYLNGNPGSSEAGGTVDTGYMKALNKGLIPKDITVPFCIIDNGVFAEHPDFAGITFWGRSWDVNTATNDISQSYNGQGHGTGVAGLMVARHNDFGIAGLLTATNVMIAKYGWRDYRINSEVTEAIIWAVTNGAKVINMDWGTPSNDAGLSNAVALARSYGAVVVCATANVNWDIDVTDDFPSSWKFDNVIVVTAIRRTGEIYASAHGKTTVHLGAPGRVVATTGYSLQYPYIYMTGSSIAAPIVSSCMVLLAQKWPNQSYLYWKERLLKGVTADPNLSETVSGGFVNFDKALSPDVPRLTIKRGSMVASKGTATKAVAFANTVMIGLTNCYSNGVYTISGSSDMVNWWPLTEMQGDTWVEIPSFATSAFFRAQIK